jgi:quaternary ammonium compound-resistance protein SugE
MAWTCLIIAGLLEIGWAIGLKYTQGFSRLWPSVMTVTAMTASFGLLSQALKTIPVGTGYAVWTGIGAAGTAILGMVFFDESRDVLRIVCLAMRRLSHAISIAAQIIGGLGVIIICCGPVWFLVGPSGGRDPEEAAMDRAMDAVIALAVGGAMVFVACVRVYYERALAKEDDNGRPK